MTQQQDNAEAQYELEQRREMDAQDIEQAMREEREGENGDENQ